MASASKNVRDPNTLSNYHNWLTTNTTIAFDIDFERNVLSGKVQLQLKAQNKDEKPEILLDTSYLSIGYVKLDGERAKFELVSRFEPYGSVLKIEVPANHGGENLQLDVFRVFADTANMPADRPLTRSKSRQQRDAQHCSG